MKIYSFLPETGEYVGSSEADPDPMNEGEFLFPAFSVTVEPPAAQEGMARVWNGTDWNQVSDYRGQTWWNAEGRPVKIASLGNPADDGYTDQPPQTPEIPPPPPAPSLVAVALLQVVEEEVFTVGVAAGVAFALWMGPGLIRVFFSQEMPDLSYSYSYTVTPSSGQATVTDRQLSYMEITVSGSDGQPVDPAEISVQVYRATT